MATGVAHQGRFLFKTRDYSRGRKSGLLGGGKFNRLIYRLSLFLYWKSGGNFTLMLNWRRADKVSGSVQESCSCSLKKSIKRTLSWHSYYVVNISSFLVFLDSSSLSLPAEGALLCRNNKAVDKHAERLYTQKSISGRKFK